MVAWTTVDLVAAALGPGAGEAFLEDPYSVLVVAAANDVCFDKRAEAGYSDDPAAEAPAPKAKVSLGTTIHAVDLWRMRAANDGFAEFEGLSSFTSPGPNWGTVKRLLGIGKAQVDAPPSDEVVAARRRALRYL